MESLRIAASKGLRDLLAEALNSGFFKVGQIVFRPTGDGFRLFHHEDEGRSDLKVYTDAGVSAATLERPALAELLGAIRRREVAAVVVLKLDRLTRRLRDLLDMVESFTASGVEPPPSASGALSPTSPSGLEPPSTFDPASGVSTSGLDSLSEGAASGWGPASARAPVSAGPEASRGPGEAASTPGTSVPHAATTIARSSGSGGKRRITARIMAQVRSRT
jgi:hypothetical protein